MAQTIAQAEKKRFYLDGEELQGLTNIGTVTLQRTTIDIPEFNVTRRIENGVTTLPEVEATFRVDKDSSTFDTIKQWYEQHEEHEVTIVRTDATGVEFARTVMSRVALIRYEEPAYDATGPDYARVDITMVPFDLQLLGSEV